MPRRSARSADIGLAVKAISCTMRIGAALRKVTMPLRLYGTPSLAGVTANVTSGAATIRSQANTASQAPPQTPPSSMAITGAGKFSISRIR